MADVSPALVGAVLAAGVAWGSILVARRVPFERVFGRDGVRRLAAGSLAIAGLVVLGVPMPWWGPWVGLGAAAAGLAAAEYVSARQPVSASRKT